MRIASTQYSATMNDALQQASGKLEDIMQQISSGKRILRPSDDPIASVRLTRLDQEDNAITQYRSNIAALRSRLQDNETAMSSLNKDMLQVRDTLVSASDGTNTPADLNAMATPLAALRDSLLATANRQDSEGRYQFGGTATSQAPIAFNPAAPAGSRYTFQGNTDKQLVVVGNGVTQPGNVSVEEMAALLNTLDSTIATMASPTVVNDATTHAAVAASVTAVDTAMTSIEGKITVLGGIQNSLSTLDDNHASVALSNQQAAITLGQTDYNKAAVELNGYTTAVQAAQKAYGRVSQLSLFSAL